MEIMYKNTRDAGEKVTASQAILNGLANNGGLYVPTEIPKLDVPMESLAEMSYQEIAYEVMSRFYTDFTEEELKTCIERAYDEKFDTPNIAALKVAGRDLSAHQLDRQFSRRSGCHFPAAGAVSAEGKTGL